MAGKMTVVLDFTKSVQTITKPGPTTSKVLRSQNWKLMYGLKSVSLTRSALGSY